MMQLYKMCQVVLQLYERWQTDDTALWKSVKWAIQLFEVPEWITHCLKKKIASVYKIWPDKKWDWGEKND